MTVDDSQIIELIRKGQTEAYGDLVRQYHKRVLGHCYFMLLNHTEADEAAQDIFVKGYLSLNRFKGDSSFSTWLYRITVNHCLDVLRKRNRRKDVSLESMVEKDGDHVEKLFATPGKADSRLENRELADKVLSTLSEEHRQILILREAEELEYKEIAHLLNCSMDAVKGRLARARGQLRENLRRIQKTWKS
jgi:RNA polymerase sigma-70 factor, ECF subfamily